MLRLSTSTRASLLKRNALNLKSSIAYFSSSVNVCKDISRITVIGAGQMGLGIALVAANKAGATVRLLDNSAASLEKGLTFLGKFFSLAYTH